MHYLDVMFRNEAQALDLAGMSFVPQGQAPFPAMAIVHGAGTSPRDSIWYLTLANCLPENGVLVLLPDKRGSEKSEGDWCASSYEDLATDRVVALEYLKTQDVARCPDLASLA